MAWDLERVLRGWEHEDSGMAGGLSTNAADPAPLLADVAAWVRTLQARIAELERENAAHVEARKAQSALNLQDCERADRAEAERDALRAALEPERERAQAVIDEMAAKVQHFEELVCLPGRPLALPSGGQVESVATVKLGKLVAERDALRDECQQRREIAEHVAASLQKMARERPMDENATALSMNGLALTSPMLPRDVRDRMEAARRAALGEGE